MIGVAIVQVPGPLSTAARAARYEQGVSVPTVDKLDELLRAVAPDRDIVVRESAA